MFQQQYHSMAYEIDSVLSTQMLNSSKLNIPISMLHTQAYCECQIYLQKVKGIEIAPNENMLKGAEKHDELEQEHLKKATLKLTKKEAMQKAIDEKITLIARETWVNGKYLFGKIDEIHYTPTKIIIIDDKPGDSVYISAKKQVWGYCTAFSEQFSPEQQLVSVVRNRDTGAMLWQEDFTEEQKDTTVETVNRIHRILLGKMEPVPTKFEKKCIACRYNSQCKWKKQ